MLGEELSCGRAGIAVSIIANTLGSAPVMLSGSDEQRAKWLPPLVESPILCAFGLTEPNAGSDVSGIGTTAVRKGDKYVINGSKMFITNAGHADWLVVFASTDKSKGHAACRRSSFRPTSTASSSRSPWTRWAIVRPTRPPSRSATSRCPPTTGSAKRARVQDRHEDARFHPPGHCRGSRRGSHRQRSTTRSNTRRRGCSSGSRSR